MPQNYGITVEGVSVQLKKGADDSWVDLWAALICWWRVLCWGKTRLGQNKRLKELLINCVIAHCEEQRDAAISKVLIYKVNQIASLRSQW